MEIIATVKKLKTPASILGAFILIFIGAYIMFSNSMSVGNKNDPSTQKEVPTIYRRSLGFLLLLTGVIIAFTHMKKQD